MMAKSAADLSGEIQLFDHITLHYITTNNIFHKASIKSLLCAAHDLG